MSHPKPFRPWTDKLYSGKTFEEQCNDPTMVGPPSKRLRPRGMTAQQVALVETANTLLEESNSKAEALLAINTLLWDRMPDDEAQYVTSIWEVHAAVARCAVLTCRPAGCTGRIRHYLRA